MADTRFSEQLHFRCLVETITENISQNIYIVVVKIQIVGQYEIDLHIVGVVVILTVIFAVYYIMSVTITVIFGNELPIARVCRHCEEVVTVVLYVDFFDLSAITLFVRKVDETVFVATFEYEIVIVAVCLFVDGGEWRCYGFCHIVRSAILHYVQI